MSHTPLFSCVIPVKGDRTFFCEAIDSLKAQGFGDDLEIIVQDADVEPDAGQSDALNKGFAKAKGEWLFWLNADDVLLPGALGKVKELIAKAGEDLRGGGLSDCQIDGLSDCCSRAGGKTGQSDNQTIKKSDNPSHNSQLNWITGNELFIDAEGRKVGCSVGNSWHDWLYRHSVPHVHGPSAFFRRELLESVGGFDVSLKYCMDWDLWIKFKKAGARFVRIDDFLWAQRRWSGSKTQRELSKEEIAVQHGEIADMLKRNDFRVTSLGVFKLRLWRLLSGCYFREWLQI